MNVQNDEKLMGGHLSFFITSRPTKKFALYLHAISELVLLQFPTSHLHQLSATHGMASNMAIPFVEDVFYVFSSTLITAYNGRREREGCSTCKIFDTKIKSKSGEIFFYICKYGWERWSRVTFIILPLLFVAIILYFILFGRVVQISFI